MYALIPKQREGGRFFYRAGHARLIVQDNTTLRQKRAEPIHQGQVACATATDLHGLDPRRAERTVRLDDAGCRQRRESRHGVIG